MQTVALLLSLGVVAAVVSAPFMGASKPPADHDDAEGSHESDEDLLARERFQHHDDS